jgi:hypothetical protein
MSHFVSFLIQTTRRAVERRNKFVTFTVDLQRDGGPLGLTLATEGDASSSLGPIFISALMEDGLAERTKTIQVGDQLAEVNGVEVRGKSLNEVIPMLQVSSDVIRLKLARLMSIPERDFNATTLGRNSGGGGGRGVEGSSEVWKRKPPLPVPSPRYVLQSSCAPTNCKIIYTTGWSISFYAAG